MRSSSKQISDDDQSELTQKFKEKIYQSHNGYLKKFKSIFTDQYALKPYFLDENLERSRSQPSFITSGSAEDVYHMRHAIVSDGMVHARQLAMLRSCSGYQLRSGMNNTSVIKVIYMNHVKFRNQSLLTSVISLPKRERSNHKCRHLHHQDALSKVFYFDSLCIL